MSLSVKHLLIALAASWHVSSSLGFAPLSGSSAMRRAAVKTNIAPINNVEAFMGINTEVRENDKVLNFPVKDYFYGRVDIELGEGYKTMTEDFMPSWKDDQSSLACVEADLPLGMVIEESETLEGKFEIAEVAEGSNAEKAGVKVGDVFRACSAQKGKPPVDNGEAQGGEGNNMMPSDNTPKKALFNTKGMRFEAVMTALATNAAANGGTGRVAMVFERRYEDAEARVAAEKAELKAA